MKDKYAYLVDAQSEEPFPVPLASGCDDPAPHRFGDLNGRQPDGGTPTVDEHGLPGLDVEVLDRLLRRQHDDTEPGGLDVRDVWGLEDEAQGREGDVLSHGADLGGGGSEDFIPHGELGAVGIDDSPRQITFYDVWPTIREIGETSDHFVDAGMSMGEHGSKTLLQANVQWIERRCVNLNEDMAFGKFGWDGETAFELEGGGGDSFLSSNPGAVRRGHCEASTDLSGGCALYNKRLEQHQIGIRRQQLITIWHGFDPDLVRTNNHADLCCNCGEN